MSRLPVVVQYPGPLIHPCWSLLSHLHFLLSSLHGGGGRHRCDVEARLHHDAGLAEVDAVLQVRRGLSQSLQVLLGLPVQVLVHVDWRGDTDRKRQVSVQNISQSGSSSKPAGFRNSFYVSVHFCMAFVPPAVTPCLTSGS